MRTSRLGEVLVIDRALCKESISAGLVPKGVASPDGALLEGLGEGRRVTVSSGDRLQATVADSEPGQGGATPHGAPAVADLQTAAILAVARSLGIAAASLLVAERDRAGSLLADDAMEVAMQEAGRSAAASLNLK